MGVDAREQLAVVERDAVVAGEQAEARLGAGRDLRPVALAVDRSGGHEVLVEERRDDADVGRDVEVGLVEQVVDRGLEVPRGLPGPLGVAGLQRLEGLVDAVRGRACRWATVVGAVVLGQGLSQVIIDEVDPALAVGLGSRGRWWGGGCARSGRAAARPRPGGPAGGAIAAALRGPGRQAARGPCQRLRTSGRSGSAASSAAVGVLRLGVLAEVAEEGSRRSSSSPVRWDPGRPGLRPGLANRCDRSSPLPHSSKPQVLRR